MSNNDNDQSSFNADQPNSTWRSRRASPPSAFASGWLNHLPRLPPADVPRAPVSFVMDTTANLGSDDATWRNEPLSYTEFLLGHHPAYAPPALNVEQPQSFITDSSWETQYHRGRSISDSQKGPLSSRNSATDLRQTDTQFSQPSNSVNAGLEDSDGLVHNSLYHALPPSHQVPKYQQRGEKMIFQPEEVQIDPSQIDPQLLDSSVCPPAKSRGQPPKRVREDEVNIDTEPSKRQKGERLRGRRKGEVRGPRPMVEPGEDFTKVYNRALDAFIEKHDMRLAHTLVLQAIGLNPEIYAAHSLLADVHFAQGRHEAGLDALMVGLHAHTNDVELWRHIADRILGIDTEAYRKRVERAMYCYSVILRKDGKDTDARFQRCECARVLKSYNRAFGDIDILMQDEPHNSSFLAQFAKLCEEVDDVPKACQIYEDHFEHYIMSGITEESHFTWSDVSIYVGLLLQQSQTGQAIQKLKQLSRLLCGRQDESFWDAIDDDREFDQMHYPRRLEIPDFVPNRYPEDVYGDALPLDLRGKLGILRLKQGFREEAWSHFQWLEPDLEGEDSLVEEYSDTFYEIAQALHDAKEHEQALQFYEALCSGDVDLGLDFWMEMGNSCTVCARKERAIQCFLRVLDMDKENIVARTQLTKLYRELGDRATAIKYGNEAVIRAQAMIPQTMNRKYERREQRLIREAAEDALKKAFRMPKGPGRVAGKVPRSLLTRSRRARPFDRYVPEPTEEPEPVIRIRQPRTIQSRANKAIHGEDRMDANATTDLLPAFLSGDDPFAYDQSARPTKRVERTHKLQGSKQTNLVKHYEEIQQLYHTLLTHQDAMREGDEIATNLWMDCAIALTDDFRTVKAFYPSERYRRFEGYSSHHPQPCPASPVQENQATTSSEQRRLAPPGLPDDYCGIRFAAWLDIFLELAILYATAAPSADNQSDCYALMNSTIECSLFYHDLQVLTDIYSCYLSCALALHDDVTLYHVVLRWFMREYAFCTDTFRLYQAITLVNELPAVKGGKAGQLEGAVFKSGPNQKFAFRQMVSIDSMLPPDYNKDGVEGPVPEFMRKFRDEARKFRAKPPVRKAHDDEQPQSPPVRTPADEEEETTTLIKTFTPREMDAVLFILYGQLMMASNSFTNSLSYLYRAYSLDPQNSVCLLSMALCYLHELFKRQTNNRHGFALLGWAWFGKYEEARTSWAQDVDNHILAGKTTGPTMSAVVRQEIEYNRARCFEMLGMADLAMRSYETVLDGATDEDDNDGWTMETAYAMSTMYALNGNVAKAREITDKYLVL